MVLHKLTRNVLGITSSAFDRAVTLAVQRTTLKHRPEREPKEDRTSFLESLTLRYVDASRELFHPEPVPLAPTRKREAEIVRGLVTTDLMWESNLEPFLPELAQRYRRTVENHVAAARLFTRGAPRPVVVVLHGYMTGTFGFEQRIWPIAWFDRRGVDVALFVLPFHGRRADPRRRGAPEFPGRDPRIANEGFRQAIFDLRGLIGYLREAGHPAVGLLGMSLGGYTAALAATIERRLDFVVPMIPLASLADFALEQGALSVSPEMAAREQALLDEVHSLVSPLGAPSLVPPERVLVIGARADRITPIAHAKRLANHFGAPLYTFQGGHLLQFGRGDAFRRMGELLVSLGVMKPR